MSSIVFITRAGEIDSDPFDPAALRATMLAATSWDEKYADNRRTKLTWRRPGLSAIVELPRKATNGILPPHITITLRSGSRATLAADYREFMLAMHGVAEQVGGGRWDQEEGRTLTAETSSGRPQTASFHGVLRCDTTTSRSTAGARTSLTRSSTRRPVPPSWTFYHSASTAGLSWRITVTRSGGT